MLKEIQKKLIERGLVSAQWADGVEAKAALVKLYRDYYDGNHRLNLTSEMKNLLRINDDTLDRFNANYSKMVVNSMADRLTVDGIEVIEGESKEGMARQTPTNGEENSNQVITGDLEAYLREAVGANGNASAVAQELIRRFGASANEDNLAQSWADKLLSKNRFDALQIDIREAMLRDGDAFVMVQHVDEGDSTKLSHEMAYDGDYGVIVVYDRQNENIVAGIRIWHEATGHRINIYYPEIVERYLVETIEGGIQKELTALESVDTTRNGEQSGVPIIHFKHTSELVNVIPLQDSLNRQLMSMVMSSELAGFPMLFSAGFKLPQGMMPGMVISVMVEAVKAAAESEDKELIAAVANLMSALKIERIEGGSLEQFISGMDFVIGQIGTITHTPLPAYLGGDSQSGEALKQREVGLLGKVSSAQVRMGNHYEDMLMMAHKFHRMFGTGNPPAIESFNSRWVDAQIRNELEVLAEAEWYHDKGYERHALRLLGHDEKMIDKLLAEKEQATQQRVQNASGQLPGFEQFEPFKDAEPLEV